ncbi:hypothetical protein DFH08DRAFT_955606 [Mycena albidolilacea]|uniref:Uncharacterized protein n=1 Tax=Mycena albidolilacea TaxID=1033008 RepID=A0AAD7ABB7_9AGAR|nr:hypothetical protein DFH08DRAFT_955606 [Mycena albidolilacea]
MNTIPTTVQIERLYSTLELAAKCDHTTFTDITLHTSPDAVPMPPALVAAQAMFTVDTLHHLFCFCTLTAVDLVPPAAAGFDFDDAAIEAIARASPNVWLLHGDSDSALRPPAPRGIREFARNRAQRRSLGITRFDASVVPHKEHDHKSAKHPLMCVDVQDSFVVDPEPVAAYLLSVFPLLKGLLPITRDHASDDLQGWADMLAGLRKEVHRLLRSMRFQANQ